MILDTLIRDVINVAREEIDDARLACEIGLKAERRLVGLANQLRRMPIDQGTGAVLATEANGFLQIKPIIVDEA